MFQTGDFGAMHNFLSLLLPLSQVVCHIHNKHVDEMFILIYSDLFRVCSYGHHMTLKQHYVENDILCPQHILSTKHAIQVPGR